MSIDPDESFSIPDLCRTLFETMPLGVVYQSTSGIIITANPAAQKILGLTLDQIQSRTSFDPNWRAIHEDGSDFPGEEHPSMLAIRTGSAVRDVVMGVFNPLTGGFTWINITAIPQFRNQGEPPDVVIVTFEDITERKQFERKIIQLKRLYATLSQVNQTVVRVKDRIDLYQSICNVAVQFGEFALAWVGLLDESSGEIRPVAANGLDVAQWPFELVNINQGSSKNGLVATAIRTSRVVTSEDIEVDNRVQSLQKQLLKYNFHSIAAIPFRLRDRAIGILTLVSREAGLFKAVEEVRLLEEMGLDISFALDMIETKAERKQAEQALKQSEAALQKAQQVAHVGSWAWRIPENRLEWSNEMYHIFGIDRASFTGQLSDVITHAIHPDDRAIVDQSNMSVVEKKTPIPLEYRVVWEDGTVRTVWAEAGELILDDEGRAALLTGIVQDITERKRAEKALYESEKRFFILFEKSSFAAALSRMPDGVLLAVNEAFEKTFGFTKQESIGRTSHDLGINPDAEGRSHILAALKAGGSARNVEMPFRTKSGEERIFSVNVDLVEISDQKYILNTTQDITERKRAEEQLARLVERFDLAARAAQLGVWDWSIANDQLVWDERMYELYGVKKEDFSGAYDAWLQGLHPDDRLGSFEISQQAIQREKEYGTEFRVIWPNGSIHWLKAYGQVIHDASGKPQRMIGVNFEITDQKSAEAKMLRQTERLKILADASLAFAAVSQDYQAVLDQVVHQVVNVMADMCQIRLISDDGQLLELASIYSRDIKYSEVFRSITTSASERSDDPGLAPHVFRTGEPALVPVLNVDQLRASVPPEYWPKYEHFLPHSYMIVALRVMGRSIGVMSLTRYQSEQPAFAQDDLDLVQDLASRAALAINNAHLLSQLQDELTKRARIENDFRES